MNWKCGCEKTLGTQSFQDGEVNGGLESCPFLVSATEQAGSGEQHPATPSLTGHSLAPGCARLITTPKVPEFVSIIKPPS